MRAIDPSTFLWRQERFQIDEISPCVKGDLLDQKHPVQNQIARAPIRGVSCGLPEGRRTARPAGDRRDRALANTKRLVASVSRAMHCTLLYRSRGIRRRTLDVVGGRREGGGDFLSLSLSISPITIMMSVFYAATAPHRTAAIHHRLVII